MYSEGILEVRINNNRNRSFGKSIVIAVCNNH